MYREQIKHLLKNCIKDKKYNINLFLYNISGDILNINKLLEIVRDISSDLDIVISNILEIKEQNCISFEVYKGKSDINEEIPEYNICILNEFENVIALAGNELGYKINQEFLSKYENSYVYVTANIKMFAPSFIDGLTECLKDRPSVIIYKGEFK